MDPQQVRELEAEIESAIESAIAAVLERHNPPRLERRTTHLMAKAAVTVLEAVAEVSRRDSGRQ